MDIDLYMQICGITIATSLTLAVIGATGFLFYMIISLIISKRKTK